MNIYYVYQYLREDGTPYYIGKGKGNRAYVKHIGIQTPKDKDRIQIIAHKLSSAEAYQLEEKLILQYGRKDLGTGTRRNSTNGGSGIIGLSENAKKKIGAAHKGKIVSAETREKMSKAQKGIPKSEETKSRMRKPKRLRSPEHSLAISLAKKGTVPWNKGLQKKCIF